MINPVKSFLTHGPRGIMSSVLRKFQFFFGKINFDNML